MKQVPGEDKSGQWEFDCRYLQSPERSSGLMTAGTCRGQGGPGQVR